jgi:hypothetical protein
MNNFLFQNCIFEKGLKILKGAVHEDFLLPIISLMGSSQDLFSVSEDISKLASNLKRYLLSFIRESLYSPYCLMWRITTSWSFYNGESLVTVRSHFKKL